MRRDREARERSYRTRKVEFRELRDRILIVCEGAKTEPAYFKSFRVPKEVVEVYGAGDNTVGVVEKAIELQAETEYDQVWCVFDRDSFPVERFNRALDLARRNGFHVAYSNEAFELWYLLHFNYYHTPLTREQYKERLSKLLGYKYRKNSTNMYEDLLARQATALKHAARLLSEYDPSHPAHDNPSTTVHLLVEQLNRFLLK